jgi:phosphoribosyl-AMP cyclohydrolase / phosphoribosyl-ATP pyrophosphohydrolase
VATIDFQKSGGLVPVVTQDSETKQVLMLAYMDKEALELTVSTGFAHYFSRSKNRIWKKGEESGHTQEIVDVLVDCDNDTILLLVRQIGVACHTGTQSCFFTSIKTNERVLKQKVDTSKIYGVIDTLYHEILSKKNGDPEKSYTAQLYKKGVNTIGKKIVEEAAELAFSLKDADRENIVYEAADLVYHALVGLGHYNISPDAVKSELSRRFGMGGIEEKNSRQK